MIGSAASRLASCAASTNTSFIFTAVSPLGNCGTSMNSGAAPLRECYMEALTRTNTSGGMVFMTFTPLLGYSEVVDLFIKECGLDMIDEKKTRRPVFDYLGPPPLSNAALERGSMHGAPTPAMTPSGAV
jgi:hypothetical protein